MPTVTLWMPLDEAGFEPHTYFSSTCLLNTYGGPHTSSGTFRVGPLILTLSGLRKLRSGSLKSQSLSIEQPGLCTQAGIFLLFQDSAQGGERGS